MRTLLMATASPLTGEGRPRKKGPDPRSARRGSVTGATRAVVGWMVAAVLVGCAGPSRTTPVTVPGGTKALQITVGSTLIDPEDVTIGANDPVAFFNRAVNPMRIEFIQPHTDQPKRITCSVQDPKTLKPGERPWATFNLSPEGHLVADVPPGPFLSTCSFAKGFYAYTVKELVNVLEPPDTGLGQ